MVFPKFYVKKKQYFSISRKKGTLRRHSLKSGPETWDLETRDPETQDPDTRDSETWDGPWDHQTRDLGLWNPGTLAPWEARPWQGPGNTTLGP